MLRLKGQTESGEWVEFDVGKSLDLVDQTGMVQVYKSDDTGAWVFIDPATIQPADDPRKAMLENVRDRFIWLFGNNKTHSIISLVQVNSIIDEMEAKL